jgi:CubicO group peptidase (beta-lactamase class C family)
MQRVVLTLAVTLLVVASLAAGSLAAHWPFWQRAWAWHVAADGWPASIDGAVQVLHGGESAIALEFHADTELQATAATAHTQALLRAGADGNASAWFAPGLGPNSQVDGRGLTAMVLAPLFAQLLVEQPELLDKPVAAWLPEWGKEDRRGVITSRQLFWQLSGMPAGDFNPLNPFNRRAQLAAGPDFPRVALRWQPGWPPGSHFEESPVNAQLLAMVAAAATGTSFKTLLQEKLWSRVAADDAAAMLDHRDGEAAAHCCLRASVADWFRLALLIAADGRNQLVPWPAGFAAQLATASPVHESYGLGFEIAREQGRPLLMASSSGRIVMIDAKTGAALLWIGEGAPPSGLVSLLSAGIPGTHRPVPVP